MVIMRVQEVEHVISRHRVPEQLLSDRGKNFLLSLVQLVCKLIGTKKINTLGYHLQCDGLVEKFNGTLISMLSKSVGKYGRDWDKHLPYFLFAYRIALQELIKASPFYPLYGREPIPTGDALSEPRTIYELDFPISLKWLQIFLMCGYWLIRTLRRLRGSRSNNTRRVPFPL